MLFRLVTSAVAYALQCRGRPEAADVDFEIRGKQPALAQETERRFPIFRLDHPFNGSAVDFNRLIAKRTHSRVSPEETRRISSSVVIPSTAFCKASWCIVTIVFFAAALSSALEAFRRMSSLSSPVIGKSSKMPMRPR